MHIEVTPPLIQSNPLFRKLERADRRSLSQLQSEVQAEMSREDKQKIKTNGSSSSQRVRLGRVPGGGGGGGGGKSLKLTKSQSDLMEMVSSLKASSSFVEGGSRR